MRCPIFLRLLAPRIVGILGILALSASLSAAATVTWDNSDADSLWVTANNWDTNVEPTSADDLVFPGGLGGAITLAFGEQGLSLDFDDDFTFSGGGLTLAAGNSVDVAAGVTATINTGLTATGGLSKTGDGVLVLGASNSLGTGTDIAAGTLRVTNNSGLGGFGTVTTVNSGTTLEFSGNISPARSATLMDGGTVAGTGTPTNNGTLTIDVAATDVIFATTNASDVFTSGTASNGRTGGTAATTINIAGSGTIRLAGASNYPGSWNVPEGVLQIGNATALGNQNTSGVTLAGGVLSPRMNFATNFANSSPAANITVTADSGLRSDRTGNGGGQTHTLGALAMGGQTLTVDPGANVTSGTATILLDEVTLSGDPTFAVNDSGSANGRLSTGSLLGGGVARTITKTGAGDLTVTGGSTDLPAGSSFTATGGGEINMTFPTLGAGATIAVTAAQHPFGEAPIDITGGALRLRANGSNTNATQVYEIPNALALGGTITLDPNKVSGNNSNKTFQFPGMTLAAGSVLSIEGDNTHGVGLTGPLALQGSATLKGVDVSGRDGRFTLDGGISGAAGTALDIGGGTSPMNLTINAPSTYGGGTTMSGSNVTLNAVDGLGTGSITLGGGVLEVNVADALNGTLTLNGGTLRTNGADLLSSNPIVLAGGNLDLRDNVSSTVMTGGITVSGTSTFTVGRVSSGFSEVLGIPDLDVSGDTTLTINRLNNFIADFQNIDLAGDLTFSPQGTVRVQTINEDAPSRSLTKLGVGTLELEGANNYSGGTEVLAGVLFVKHSDALGSGVLTLGDTTGNANATGRFDAGLTISNDIVARAGGTGNLTLDASSSNVIWDGGIDLQRTLQLDNGGFSQIASINGVVSGAGGVNKITFGEIALTNAGNTFGSGAADSVTVTDGRLTATSDGALGNAANGVTLAGNDGVLKIDGTFASGRTITATGTATGVNVTAGNDFTMNAPIAGSGAFIKSGDGTVTLAAGLDSSARGAATSGFAGGVLRVQSQKGLSDAGLVTFNSSSGGTLELLADVDTDFGHPITQNSTGAIHVDRAIGGSASNGRHTLGDVNTTSGVGTLTVTGDNGFGLTIGDYTTGQSKTLINDAPGELRVSSITGNPGTGTRTLTVGGDGDTVVSGAMTQGAGTGVYQLTKNGPGTFRLGTAITGFGDITKVRDGTLDLNGLTYLSEDLDLAGVASVGGAQIVTGAGGALQLATGLNFASGGSPAGAKITGTVDLGAVPQPFVVANSLGAPVDLEVEGALVGIAGSDLTKSSSGALRLSGAGNTFPGLTTVSGGVLELDKSSGDGIGTGGVSVTNSTVSLIGSEQINDAAPVMLSGNNDTKLELNDNTETIGATTLAQSDPFDYTGIRTGATGTLALAGNIVLSNNGDHPSNDERAVLITGTGNEFTPTSDGTLDLGGATRTIEVTTTTTGGNEVRANATIETQIINGGIVKTGPRTLFLGHPNNTFAGGLEIAEGSVVPASAASLGAGPVTFTNTGATVAGIDLGAFSGTYADDLTLSGNTTITYSADAPDMLTMTGDIDLGGDLTFDVVEGTIYDFNAVLDVAGAIDDAAGTSTLTKVGEGTLKLAAGNTYSGGTSVFGGVLSIPADNALGDSTAALTVDGGNLSGSASFSFARDIVFGAAGGTMHSEEGTLVEVPGDLTWSADTNAFYGSGTAVLSGTTSGAGGDLWVGTPAPFATGNYSESGTTSKVLSLRGATTMPAGNVRIVNGGVLELGNGDFTHPIGIGAGEVQLNTNRSAGWAAHGADRTVNLGGAGAAVVWGQVSPPFLHRIASGSDYGDLVLGSATATHTVDFANPLELNNGQSFVFRDLIINDGPAALDASLSGGISNSALNTAFLDITGEGSLDITGPVSAGISLTHSSTGTTTLSGANSLDDDFNVDAGTLVFASDASFGTPQSIFIEFGGTLDASALTSPISLPAFESLSVEGPLLGSVETASYFEGGSSISGDVRLLAPAFGFASGGGFGAPPSHLDVGGDFTLDAGTRFEFFATGLVPDVDYYRITVAGSVSLAGTFDFSGTGLALGDSVVFIENSGTDPISGTFDGLPEGTLVPIGDSLALQLSYVANGDGGAVANDFGVTVVEDTFSTDLSVEVDAQLAAALGGPIVINYDVFNAGAADVTDGVLDITLPANATLVGSTPSGTLTGSVLSVPLPSLIGIDSTTVQLDLTAPGVESTVFVEAEVSSSTVETELDNNSAASLTAVFGDGDLEFTDGYCDPITGDAHLSFDTVDGVDYIIERSDNLEDWIIVDFINGDGTPYDYISSKVIRRFYRLSIVPYDDFGGGKGEK